MTPDEIQALREKHQPVKWNNGFMSCDVCTEIIEGHDYPVLYPCDVIKVLDAWEAERTMNVAPLINAYLKTNVYTNLYTNEDYDL